MEILRYARKGETHYYNIRRDGKSLTDAEFDAALLLEKVVDLSERRDYLLKEAATRLAPLQDAVDLGSATAADKAQLLSWKQYRVDLNRISEQEGYPAEVVWPEPPSA